MHLRYCICTLLMGGNTYAKGAVALCKSIRNNLNIGNVSPNDNNEGNNTYSVDIVCMVTDDVTVTDELKIYDRIIRVDKITYTKSIGLSGDASKGIYKWICDSPTKWSFLSFTEYNKVLFLDSDMIVVGPIMDIFNITCPAAMFDHQCSTEYVKDERWLGSKDKGFGFRNWYLGKKNSPNKLSVLPHGSLVKTKYIKRLLYNLKSQFAPNGGLVLVEPKEDLLSKYKDYIANINYGEKTLSGIDEISITLFMHKMGYKWTHVDMKYNTSAYHCSSIINDIRIIHYIGPYKPWYEGETEYINKIEQYVSNKEHIGVLLKLWELWWNTYNNQN